MYVFCSPEVQSYGKCHQTPLLTYASTLSLEMLSKAQIIGNTGTRIYL